MRGSGTGTVRAEAARGRSGTGEDRRCWTRARGEKTRTFRINIVPRSRKEKGRSPLATVRAAEDRTRIRGRTRALFLSSLSSLVAIVDFTVSEGRLSSQTIVADP